MIDFYAERYSIAVESMSVLKRISFRSRKELGRKYSRASTHVESLMKFVSDLGLVGSLSVGARLRSLLLVGGVSMRDEWVQKEVAKNYRRMVEHFESTLQEEIEATYFIPVPRFDYYLYNQFTKSAMDQFREARFDMEEAGKCFALERYSATVFHLQLVVGKGLDRIRDDLKLSLSARKKNNWGEIVAKMLEESKTLDRVKDRQQINQLAALFVAPIKEAWRNPAMHGEGAHEPEYVKTMFAAIVSFMDALAGIVGSKCWPPLASLVPSEKVRTSKGSR